MPRFPATTALLRALDEGLSLESASILSGVVETLVTPASQAAHNRAVRLIERRANLDYELAKLRALAIEGDDRPTLVSQL